jgi:hypothetical protein
MKRTRSLWMVWIVVALVLAGCATPVATPTATLSPPTSAAQQPASTPIPPTSTPELPTATPAGAEAAPTATAVAAAESTFTPTPVPPAETPTPVPEPSWVADGAIGEDEYAHQVEAAGVTLHWVNDGEYLYAALAAQTSGWVAVGFDPETKMQGANFIFGYVAGGQTTIEDMFGIRPFGPGSHPPDEQLGGGNDVLEFGGREEEGVTVIEFKMPLDSGDQYDKSLQPGSSYSVILATGSSDNPQLYHSARDYAEISID